jgi:hypothetical protein
MTKALFILIDDSGSAEFNVKICVMRGWCMLVSILLIEKRAIEYGCGSLLRLLYEVKGEYRDTLIPARFTRAARVGGMLQEGWGQGFVICGTGGIRLIISGHSLEVPRRMFSVCFRGFDGGTGI